MWLDTHIIFVIVGLLVLILDDYSTARKMKLAHLQAHEEKNLKMIEAL